MLAAEVFARFTGEHSSLLRSATVSERAFKNVERAAKSASTSVSTSMTKADQATERSSQSFMKMLGTVTKFGAAIGILGLVGQAFEGIKSATIDYNSILEQAEIGFTTMLGSAAAAGRMMERLQRFAATTPFEFKGLLASTRQLMAFGFEAQETLPTLRIIGDAVSAMGGSMEDMGDRVIRSFGQMQAKGKVSAEEMMQLAEAGLPAWQYLADAIGTDIPTAMQRAKTEGVAASIAIDGILKGMNRDFGGMMEAQSKTMMGAWSNVMDFLQQQTAKATRGVFNRFRDLILQAGEFLGSPQAAAMGDRFAQIINDAIEGIADAVGPVIEQFIDTLERVIPAAIDVVSHLKPVGIVTVAAFLAALKGAEAFLSVLERLAAIIDDNEAVAKSLAVAVSGLLAVMAAKKIMDFFSSFRMGVESMGAAIMNMGRTKVAFSEVQTQTTNMSNAMATFAATNAPAIDKVNASAGRSAFSFRTMGSSLMGAVGGPAGIAITAALVGIGYQLNKNAQEAQEAAQRTAEYKDRLVELKNIDLSSIEFETGIIQQMLKNEDLAKVFRDLDLQTRDYVDTVTEGGKALEAWDNITDDTLVNFRDFIDALADGNVSAEDLRTKFDGVTAALSGANISMDEFVKSPFTRELVRMARETGMTNEQIDKLVENLDEEADAFDKAFPAARQLTDELRKQEAETARAERASEALGETVGSIGASFGEAARSVGKAGEAIQKVRDDITEAWTGAANPFEEWAEDSLTSLDEFKTNLDERLGVIGQFSQNLMTLLQQGLDPQIVQRMAEEGPEAYALVVAELAQAPDQLAGFQDSMHQYLNLDDQVAGVQNSIELIQDILNGMTTTQLKLEWGANIQSEINMLPEYVRTALAANDQRITSQIQSSLQSALSQAQQFARDNVIELDAEIDAEEASRKFDEFFTAMPTPDVLVGANPADALATITDFLVQVGATPATVPIEGMDERARRTAQEFLDYIEGVIGTIDFEGDPEKAQEILAEFLGQVDSSIGVTTIDANMTPGQRRLLELEGAINSTYGSVTVDADTTSALGQANATVEAINNMNAFINVRLRTDQVQAQIRATGFAAHAEGGIVEAYAQGGRRENHVAQIAQAGAWRLWAEPETGGEAYIPLGAGKRSRSVNILAEVADRFGYVLVKHFANGKGINKDSMPPVISGMGSTTNNFNVSVGVNVKPTAGVDSAALARVIDQQVKKGINDTMSELLDEIGSN